MRLYVRIRSFFLQLQDLSGYRMIIDNLPNNCFLMDHWKLNLQEDHGKDDLNLLTGTGDNTANI